MDLFHSERLLFDTYLAHLGYKFPVMSWESATTMYCLKKVCGK